MDKISIIVPVFNVENYLQDAIDSLKNQTYQNLEILLIDDGSTDKSGDICDTYSKNDLRIKVFHKENEGVASARNLGLKNATGDYLGFVDPDDYALPQMFEYLHDAAKKTNSDVVICGCYETDDFDVFLKKITNIKQNIELTKYIDYSENEILDMPLYINLKNGVLWNKLYSRKAYENTFFYNLKTGEDSVYLSQWIFKKLKVIEIEDKLYIYRRNREGSLMSNRDREYIMSRISMMRILTSEYKKQKMQNRQLTMLRHACNEAIDDYLMERELKEEGYKKILKEIVDTFKEIMDENVSVISGKTIIFKIFYIYPPLGSYIRKIVSKNQYKRLI